MLHHRARDVLQGLALIALVASAPGCRRGAGNASRHEVGAIRVSALSPTLVRLEERGPRGFEDRVTFNIVNRDWPGVPLARTESDGVVTLDAGSWRVVLPATASALAEVRVEDASGTALQRLDGTTTRHQQFLPAPAAAVAAWTVADFPRAVPPPWGATPPDESLGDATSGWDVGNTALDVYVFLPGAEGYRQLRRDFLALTGPVPLPPLFTFGYWTSRWHPYREQEALAEIDAFRKQRIPLDLFVVDTDWRVGASHGYEVNKEYFPDMPRFLREAHARNVRVMFNDHPEPIGAPLDPAELTYRYQGLTSLLAMGGDVLWYDRNWDTELGEPLPGLRKESWGMRLYHDITLRFRPQQRPLIMSNVQGIDSGRRRFPSDPSAHRFPIWWTGDTYADWEFLRRAVANGVDSGVHSLLPYVNDDCGGHFLKAEPEFYQRFFQYCALSPVLRPHTSRGLSRLPWDFGPEALPVIRDYARLRYRLLPVLYAAARRAFDDGTPLLRRLDLEWPAFPEAADPLQYLLGDDLLVAPVLDPAVPFADIPDGELQRADGKPGVDLQLFAGPPGGKPLFSGEVPRLVFHGWPVQRGVAVPGGLSGRWSTTWKTPTEDGAWQVRLSSVGRARLYLDDRLVVDDTATPNDFPVTVALRRDQAVRIRVDHEPVLRPLNVQVLVSPPSRRRTTVVRTTWLPPGEWEDLWTGARHTGPRRVDVEVGVERMPLWARVGGLLVELPDMQHTGEAPWDRLVVDAWVPAADGAVQRELYEDDGLSTGYLAGAFRRTTVALQRSGNRVTLAVAPARGPSGVGPPRRDWVLRLHLPAGTVPRALPTAGSVTVLQPAVATGDHLPRLGAGVPPAPLAGPVVEVTLPARDATAPTEVTLDL